MFYTPHVIVINMRELVFLANSIIEEVTALLVEQVWLK